MKGTTMSVGGATDVERANTLTSREVIHFWLRRLGAVLWTLAVFGLACSFSATVYLNLAKGIPPYTDFLKHGTFTLGGLIAAWLAMELIAGTAPAKRWLKFIIPSMYVLSLALVAAVRLTPLGVSVDGSRRWLDIGPVTFQPSELLKVATVLYLAQLICWHGKGKRASDTVSRELSWRAWVAAILPIGLTALQPDLGSAAILFGICLLTMILAGVRGSKVAVFAGSLLVVGTLAVALVPGVYSYAHERIVTWLNPLDDPDGDGFQITQSRAAIVEGGFWGKGYLHGEQKINRLPLSTKDFVYPVVVEELGLAGGLAILLLFGYLGFAATRLAMACTERFNQAAIGTLGLAVVLQAFVNIATTVGTLPVSGITLPFFSGGGTSLVVSMVTFGLMAGLARQDPSYCLRDRKSD